VRTAIVATVRNEASRIGEFLASLERQTRKPDVIVVTDGGSTDGTQQALSDFGARTSLPFRWLEVPGNRSKGRNAAIDASQADLLAMTDASVLDPTWFERIVAPLEAGTAELVSGWYELRTERPRERTIGLLTQYSLDQVDPTRFLPSSRSVAFTRDLWARAGRSSPRPAPRGCSPSCSCSTATATPA
jgi:glycosyltransferase involved in cell wall biosynthesis